MGSFIEMNDTLQLTKEQGFPKELQLEKHLQKPFTADDFAENIFSFHDKKDIRVYQIPPTRNFLAENRDGKWIYWGMIHIVELTYDYEQRTTSGKFKITHIYSPEEMKKSHCILDMRKEKDFFAK